MYQAEGELPKFRIINKLGEYHMANRTQGRTVQKRRKRVRRHRQSVMLVSTVVLLLAVMVFFGSIKLQAKNKEYMRQEAELEAQIAEAEERSKEIEDYKNYVQTDEYAKEIAREKLGLVDPDEILFKPVD